MTTENDLKSDKRSVRNSALDEAAIACEEEALVDHSEHPCDIAYNNAIIHATQAIRALKTTSVSEVSQPDYKVACQEWSDKTEFIQEWMNKGIISGKYLGWHRADIMRDLIDTAYKQGKGK